MSTRDIEGEATQHGEVGRRIVLAAAGEIFVEQDIERPMQTVSMLQWERTMRSISAGRHWRDNEK